MQEPQDDPFAVRLEPDDLRVSLWSELLSTGPLAKLLLGIAGLGVISGLIWAFQPVNWLQAQLLNRELEVVLAGPGVDQLQAGMKVVTGQVEIGEVAELLVKDGRPAARLKISGDYASQLRTTSNFSVRSLNLYVPGNLGVRVETDAGENGVQLAGGALVTTTSPVLPAALPLGSVMLAVAGVVSLFLLGFAAKVFKNLLWVVVLLAVLLTLALLVSKILLVT